MKGVWAHLLGLFLGVCFAPLCGATVYYSDGSAANVQALHVMAQDGDTIALPSGTFAWPTGVTISKGITLQGVAGATQINRVIGYSNALITITGMPADLPVRVTGIRFNSPVGQNGDLQSVFVQGPYGGTLGLTHLRIDHCYFYGGMRTLFFRYRVNGVVDHNTFHDCAYITEYFGDDDYAWIRAGTPQFGTSDSIFFEDNSIVLDSTLSYFDVESDQNTGGKLVWRYNNFDLTAYTGTFGSIIGEHGNQAYWAGGNDWLRGGIMCEFYNNTVRWGNAFRIIWFRGGRNIVANNAFYGNLNGALVAFDEEGISNVIPPTRTLGWPAEDQVNNTFIWNNTVNGSTQDPATIYCWQSGSHPYIQLGRDYWLEPPSGNTVTNYPQPASPSRPDYPVAYNPAVTSWTPYTYPHPLTGSSPSPTPTPSASPTPTPTPSATPMPTTTPVPSPTPRATPHGHRKH